jgi:polyribonucleotide nucleotidyltransferase
MNQIIRESVMINGKPLTLETGRLAKQAHGSILVTYGESMVLVTAVSSQEERQGIDFFPLTCDYIEKTFAAGKIPGGFFKREGRQRDEEILTSRLIDRPCRPLFPDGYKNDTQVIATVLSVDKTNPTDVMALTGAGAALHISDIPWSGPVVGIRVGRIGGELIANPTFEQIAASDMELIVAASKDAVVMVEGGAAEVSESDLIDAIMFAHKSAQPILSLIEQIRAAVGKPKRTFVAKTLAPELKAKVAQLVDKGLMDSARIRGKAERYEGYGNVKKKMVEAMKAELGDKFAENEKLLKAEVEERKYTVVRGMVLGEKKRIDQRDYNVIRPISCEVGILPRVHGSSLFQRGETQAIVTTTLGTSSDEQKIDALIGERWKKFLLHYNFPPFSTGETKPLRGPGRREVGHGNLAERALSRVLPDDDGKFPYTIRVVSETLESNGSSSMAAVCGGCLSLMDAGVPIKEPVAGIAMGLIKEGDRMAVLSDITGDEDHLGDMDFKVCGTKRGITAIQMDIKVEGLSREILETALRQAKEGRLHILDKMLATLSAPRAEMSKWAPRITSIKVKPDQIRLVIGPGGKTIKGIVDQTGVAIDVEDDGTVNVASADPDAVKRALAIIQGLTAEPEVGTIYKGTVKRITDFGAFVEVLPGTDGLLHVSEMAHTRVERPEDVMKEGDEVEVKVLDVGRDGKIRLSRRILLPLPEGPAGEEATRRMEAAHSGERESRGPGGGGGRGGDRDRGRGDRDRPRR